MGSSVGFFLATLFICCSLSAVNVWEPQGIPVTTVGRQTKITLDSNGIDVGLSYLTTEGSSNKVAVASSGDFGATWSVNNGYSDNSIGQTRLTSTLSFENDDRWILAWTTYNERLWMRFDGANPPDSFNQLKDGFQVSSEHYYDVCSTKSASGSFYMAASFTSGADTPDPDLAAEYLGMFTTDAYGNTPSWTRSDLGMSPAAIQSVKWNSGSWVPHLVEEASGEVIFTRPTITRTAGKWVVVYSSSTGELRMATSTDGITYTAASIVSTATNVYPRVRGLDNDNFEYGMMVWVQNDGGNSMLKARSLYQGAPHRMLINTYNIMDSTMQIDSDTSCEFTFTTLTEMFVNEEGDDKWLMCALHCNATIKCYSLLPAPVISLKFPQDAPVTYADGDTVVIPTGSTTFGLGIDNSGIRTLRVNGVLVTALTGTAPSLTDSLPLAILHEDILWTQWSVANVGNDFSATVTFNISDPITPQYTLTLTYTAPTPVTPPTTPVTPPTTPVTPPPTPTPSPTTPTPSPTTTPSPTPSPTPVSTPTPTPLAAGPPSDSPPVIALDIVIVSDTQQFPKETMLNNDVIVENQGIAVISPGATFQGDVTTTGTISTTANTGDTMVVEGCLSLDGLLRVNVAQVTGNMTIKVIDASCITGQFVSTVLVGEPNTACLVILQHNTLYTYNGAPGVYVTFVTAVDTACQEQLSASDGGGLLGLPPGAGAAVIVIIVLMLIGLIVGGVMFYKKRGGGSDLSGSFFQDAEHY